MSDSTFIHFTAIGPVEILLFILCILQLLNPNKLKLLIVIACLQILDLFLNLPNVPNHRLVFAFINLVIVTIYFSNKKISNEDFYNCISPFLRITTIVLYFFATFHKLNSDFFNPQKSCCFLFYNNILENVTFFPKGELVYLLLPTITILTEACLPFLLFFRKTRNIALLAGLLFHFTLALDLSKHFFDFSATVFALYIAFIDRKNLQLLSTRLLNQIEDKIINKIIATLALITFIFLMTFNSDITAHLYYVLRAILWWVYSLSIIYIIILINSKKWFDNQENLFPSFKLSYLFFILALLTNGFSPYLGIKTRTAFDMYSNLQISKYHSNHFIIPFSLDLFGYQSDIVQILETEDPLLKSEYMDKNLGITFYELRRHLSKKPETRIKFLRNQQIFALNRADEDKLLTSEINFIQGKFISYRPVDLETPSRCIW